MKKWWDRFWPWILVAMLLLTALALGAVVITNGDWTDELNLVSAIAGGLVVAITVATWEILLTQRTRSQKEQELAAGQKTIGRVLTTFVGSELSGIASARQLQGIDSEGNPIELFQDIDDALRAFEAPASIQMMVVALGQASHQAQPGDQLTLASWDSISSFYERLAQQFDQMLSYFVRIGSERELECFLDLWRLQRSHAIRSGFLWRERSNPGWIQNLVTEGAPKAAYIQTARGVLGAYQELLKAIDAVPSGIPSRREKYDEFRVANRPLNSD